jgi:hypothetical protein
MNLTAPASTRTEPKCLRESGYELRVRALKGPRDRKTGSE